MGQYYYPANIDKREYINPHAFGDGLKLLEFGSSGQGTMTGLAILLAVGNGRGGGDLHSENSIVGSWAGDRIVVVGDYAEPSDHQDMENVDEETLKQVIHGLWHDANHAPDDDCALSGNNWTDISQDVMVAMADDSYLRDSLLDVAAYHHGWGGYSWDFLFTEEEIAERKAQLDKKREEERAEWERKQLRPDITITPTDDGFSLEGDTPIGG